MEHRLVVKPEMEMNGELLVLYVDENGTVDESNLQQLQEGNFIIEDVSQSSNEIEGPVQSDDQNTGRWSDEETKRLLVFYIDNKETFLNGATKKKHLWTVACKTMLMGKTSTSCEMKLRNLKKNYTMVRVDQSKGKMFIWPYYDLCHQAFHDDSYVNLLINDVARQSTAERAALNTEEEGVVVLKKALPPKAVDERVEQMLNLYLNYKKCNKDSIQRHVWESIAFELGEDADYWHKRYFNFKQHYIRMLDKRKESGPQSINWPYMHIFDEIFEDDKEFKRKYVDLQQHEVTNTSNNVTQPVTLEWNDTEKTVLVKYCFDCFDDFQDATIPKNFLWHEVGRLLDKKPEECKKKYEELKEAHLDLYIARNYNIRTRKPIAILFDNILFKDTELKLSKLATHDVNEWSVEEVDSLVQFFYDNLEMFKDPICHFVCWASVSKHLQRTLLDCRNQWYDLTALYNSILHDKKEDPEMEVDWRYIELFDRIFDYGMDTKLLEGYEVQKNTGPNPKKISVKQLNIKLEEVDNDETQFEEKETTKGSRSVGDAKQFQILEFYFKNKDRFAAAKKRKQQTLWETLATQIKISAEQCAHRFRNLKQVYISYIEREIARPEMPILWPYYNLCKKVFGYRIIKNKIKSNKLESHPIVEWYTKEIKQIVNFYAKNFDKIEKDKSNVNVWLPLAQEIGKSVTSCRDKFLELSKAYRKVKTMMNRNPNCKITWKYFKLFETAYSGKNVEEMEVDSNEEQADQDMEDEEYQCIIVLPENEENPVDVHMKESGEDDVTQNVEPKTIEREKLLPFNKKWKNKEKKDLMQCILNYVTENQGVIMNSREMWREVAKLFKTKTPLSCKNMYARMKTEYKQKVKDPEYKKSYFYSMFKKIFATKPKFCRPPMEGISLSGHVSLDNPQTFTDVVLPEWRVEQALKYYLEHIEEFVNPKYSKQYLWKELGNQLQIPGVKLFKKIHYLKNFFDKDTGEVAGEKVAFSDLIREIIDKESIVKAALESQPKIEPTDNTDDFWTDNEEDILVALYLENLDKFKNPKYVTTYLWMETSQVVGKSAVACSKKMAEIRTKYSTMVKENSEELANWRFYEMCQKIYGTGKALKKKNGE